MLLLHHLSGKRLHSQPARCIVQQRHTRSSLRTHTSSGPKRRISNSAAMDFKKGWFAELGSMWPGQAMCLEIEEVLFDQRSEYQHVLVFQYAE